MSGIRPVAKIFGILLPLFLVGAFRANAATQPRERISFNDNWRFAQGDPAGVSNELSYTNLKPWITATGAEFSTNPPSAKPEGNPGTDVPYTQPGFDDAGWQQLNLPHDWAIEGPFRQEYAGETAKLKYWGPVWYRKHFDIPPADIGKKIRLEIDGAMTYAEVWLNGQFVGGWPYGYASFELDLTPFIKFGGENVLTIRLDSPPDASRWYPGAGIYRNVWLVKTAATHVGQWGTFVTTPEVSKNKATIKIQVNIDNESAEDASVSVKSEIYELKSNGERGKSVASLTISNLKIAAQQTKPVKAQIVLKNPKLWSIAKQQRYVVVTSIVQNRKLLDNYETSFGIRTIQFTVDNGFLLNGQRVQIRGVCLHGDLGALGTALNVRALERQLQLLKEMGCNAIRTSHNPPAPELLDLCDRLGFVVMDEAFDAWAMAKRPGDYHLLFPDWHEKDLRAFIHRDRNHPCVVLWSIGNEVYEQRAADGWGLGAQLAAIVHQEDATRPVTAAFHIVATSTNGFQKVVDVFGYNYKPFGYAEFRHNNPTVPLIGSETASCVSSRGEYFFPVSTNKKLGRADFQVTSYDLAAPTWAMPPDDEFKGQDENPFVAGEFVWTGFDYLGEPTPYDRDSTNRLLFTDPEVQAEWDAMLKAGGKIEVPSRSSYFGIFDLAGFKKDRFYLYQSRWRPDLPMAHILPHWNWPERVGQITPVQVYTSGDEAELFLNGKSLGRMKKGSQLSPSPPSTLLTQTQKSGEGRGREGGEGHNSLQYRLRWDNVVYEPGTLKVVAYKNGRRWATDVVKTTGPAAKLALQVDRTAIRADGKDLSFVTLTIEDRNGLPVPRANNHIRFSIEGPG